MGLWAWGQVPQNRGGGEWGGGFDVVVEEEPS